MGRRHHVAECAEVCAAGCGVRDLKEHLGRPVLPDEIAAEKAAEERFKALARGQVPIAG